MAEFEKIAASLRHCAAGIGHCRECIEYGEPGCNRLLKEEAAESIKALRREREERAAEGVGPYSEKGEEMQDGFSGAARRAVGPYRKETEL